MREQPPGDFAKLKAAHRKRAPLSFTDLSASLAAAQRKTGFVDTLAADAPIFPRESDIAEQSPPGRTPDGEDRPDESKQSASAKFAEEAPATPQATERQRSAVVAEAQEAMPTLRKGRVRAPFVQCNLKIAEGLRDALHLQALRERRTIADLVTDVMSGYLNAKGTFDRLR